MNTINHLTIEYGRGKRSNYNRKRLNCADEIYVNQDDNLLTSSDFVSQIKESSNYVNKHIADLLYRNFISADDIVQVISDGNVVTVKNLVSTNHELTLSRPILITDSPESIGMKVPKKLSCDKKTISTAVNTESIIDTPSIITHDSRTSITIRDIANVIGMSHPVTVMDVATQDELDGWTLGDLVDYFEDETRLLYSSIGRYGSLGKNEPSVINSAGRVFNQISLEFSDTPLIKEVLSPKFVRDLDWIDNIWPHELKNSGDYPRVQNYCLTSTSGCYTDFHIDFGGTSVWYHILSGQKIFLLIPPSPQNLTLYEEWLCSKDQADVFFPDMTSTSSNSKSENKVHVEGCIRVTLNENQTFIIPTGWIHAVFTPVDSIVIGGNFLHGLGYGIKGQLDVYCLETRTRVPMKFRFPHFVRMMFYAGLSYLGRVGQDCYSRKHYPLTSEEIEGVSSLVMALKSWTMSFRLDSDRAGTIGHTVDQCIKFADVDSAEHMLNLFEIALEELSNEYALGKMMCADPSSVLTTNPHILETHSQVGNDNQIENGIESERSAVGLRRLSSMSSMPVDRVQVQSHPTNCDTSLDNNPLCEIKVRTLASQKSKPVNRKFSNNLYDLTSNHFTDVDQDEEWVPDDHNKQHRVKVVLDEGNEQRHKSVQKSSSSDKNSAIRNKNVIKIQSWKGKDVRTRLIKRMKF